MYDSEHIRYLRREAEIYAIDFSRARISPADDGYVVHLDPPLFDLKGAMDDVPPTRIDSRSALRAEGELLTWLMRIQRAERQKARVGVKCGWSGDQVNRRALTDEEIAEHKGRIGHQARVAKLQAELSEAIQSSAANAAARAASAELTSRYGLSTEPRNDVPAAVVGTPPSAHPAKRPTKSRVQP